MKPRSPLRRGDVTKRVVALYLSMLGVAAALFAMIIAFGQTLEPDRIRAGARLADSPSQPSDTLVHVLLALLVVIVLARAVGALFRRLHQPPVIGEVLAGILLGPSFLGRIAPETASFVLPPSIEPFLAVIAQVGIILYMFLVGVELNTELLRKRTHVSVAISHASIVAPFLLGTALALGLHARYGAQVPFVVFALFMGVSMSVTAFPVLARILKDQGLHTTRLGAVALACAAIGDATAWCLLAFVTSVARAEGGFLATIALTAGFIAFMLVIGRPAAHRLVRWHEARGTLAQGPFALICVALLLSALVTELIGIHALFGAFLLGAIVPHDSALARDVTARIEDLVFALLLPAFFAFAGMHTEIGLLDSFQEWLICGAIIVIASLGKWGGSTLAAKLTGLSWRPALGIGVLMNTRGLMELIVLNIGRDLGVLSPTLFAMLVVMALVTTFATAPILHALRLREVADLVSG